MPDIKFIYATKQEGILPKYVRNIQDKKTACDVDLKLFNNILSAGLKQDWETSYNKQEIKILKAILTGGESMAQAIEIIKIAKKNKEIERGCAKLSINTIYGALGSPSACIFVKMIAAAITYNARCMFNLLKEICTQEIQGEIVFGDTDSIAATYNQKNTNNVSLKKIETHINNTLAKILNTNLLKTTQEKFMIRQLSSLNSKKSYINISVNMTAIDAIEESNPLHKKLVNSIESYEKNYTKINIAEILKDPVDFNNNKFKQFWPYAKLQCKSFSWGLMGTKF